MKQHVAFLRAINVGGRTVKMDALHRLFCEIGYWDAKTFLASGNVVFSYAGEDLRQVETSLEARMQKTFGFETVVMVRTMDEVKALATYEAFSPDEVEQAGAYNLAFLKDAIPSDAVDKLVGLGNDIDHLHAYARHIYWLCAVKQSESQFSNKVLEKTLGVSSTIRGMSTINKLISRFG
ncbi:MAG: DUF1697 domain-containing protein [Anaerolineaceae bacterium]|nr:DUF1697 domain-containing protein [Anaerolineaceae bacterium]